jgi:hypothetical protein
VDRRLSPLSFVHVKRVQIRVVAQFEHPQFFRVPPQRFSTHMHDVTWSNALVWCFLASTELEWHPQPPGNERVIETVLPHSAFGDPECCGCLCGIIENDQAEIFCNECEEVIRTVPASELRNTLDHMELALDVATAICPHCRAVHLFPGFTRVGAFVCRECGKSV